MIEEKLRKSNEKERILQESVYNDDYDYLDTIKQINFNPKYKNIESGRIEAINQYEKKKKQLNLSISINENQGSKSISNTNEYKQNTIDPNIPIASENKLEDPIIS